MKNAEFPIYQSSLLLSSEALFHGISGRSAGSSETTIDGNMSSRIGNGQTAERNRKQMLQCLGIKTGRLVLPTQVHGNVVSAIAYNAKDQALRAEDLKQTDGMITNSSDVSLGILVADCIPVFLFNPLVPAAGLIHAGWRGTVKGIVSKGLRAMRERFGANPCDCLAWLGPSIGVCCFEVGDEVTEIFKNAFGHLDMDFGRFIDLKEVNRQILIQEGVPPGQIDLCSECTCCGEGFFSHRRAVRSGLEGAGRMLAVVRLHS